jgi:hypothetical protein
VATWSPVQSATAYRLDVSTSNIFTPENILTTLTPEGTSQPVDDLAPGTKYFFQVQAVNAGGVSVYSQNFPVTTLSPPQAPVITSFTPSSGPVGTSVTITGAFNPVAANNIVFFGATKATITASSPAGNSLSVLVPFGATFEQISVTDIATHLTGYSASPFITTISPAGQTFNSNSFGPKVAFGHEPFEIVGLEPIESIKTADLDDDGKSDLIVSGFNSLSIRRNISLHGTLDSVSFSSPIKLATMQFPSSLTIDDLNCDGKPDIIIANGSSVAIFFNESLNGSLSSFSRVDFDLGVNDFGHINSFAVGDLDGDGRPDLAIARMKGLTFSEVVILRNNNTFNNALIFDLPGVPISVSFPELADAIAIGDLDNDLKPDLAVMGNGVVSIFKNRATKGSIVSASFVKKVTLVGVDNSFHPYVVIGDLDSNGKQDLVVSGFNQVSVFDNIGLSDSLTNASFALKVDYTVSNVPQLLPLAISDLNGDARPELIVSSFVFPNTSNGGNGRSSFAQSINYLSGSETIVAGVVAGDLDNDRNPDLVAGSRLKENATDSKIILLHNNFANDSIANVFVTSPAHGSTGFLPTVNVSAKALSGASTYTIQLSSQEDFAGVLEKSGARGQRFTGLSYGTRYFARVKTNLSPKFGKTTSFSTVPAEDLAFVTSPADGAIDQSPNLTVVSNTVPGATNYTIDLNTSRLFLDTSISKSGSRTQVFTGLNYNTTYYSRVRTEFTQTPGETRSFTTMDASKISFITSPADGATGQPTTLNLVCNPVPGATEYSVFVAINGVFLAVETSSSRTIQVSGLAPNTSYHVQVRTNLSQQFGPVRTFTTGAALGALAAYPNPASNQVTIKNIKPDSQIRIIDAISGTLVETIHATDEELTIETTKYRRGLYYVIQVNADGSEGESMKLSVN